MHWREEGAEKLWLFVSPRFNATLCRVVRDKLRELDAGGEQVPYNVECNTPLHYKNLVLTPAFLKANRIPYHVVSQRPGTLIYVREGVFHQVINTGLNLAEAVNVGGPGWNHAAHIFVACGCTGCSVEEISPNPASYKTLTGHSTRLYECPKQGCLHTSATATQARQHTRVHVRGNSNRPQVFCHQCSLGFLSVACLTCHIGTVHSDGLPHKGFRLWSNCHKLDSSANFARHRRSTLGRASSQRFRLVLELP